ncbi:MAG: toprim domain-containing protein [bacterium]
MISTVLPAYKYLLEQRKLTEDTIRQFHLGYISREGQIYVDADFSGGIPEIDRRFHHSTMFPIFDVYGKCIAVSVRPLGPTQTKYINTAYEKSEHLYGLSETWTECFKEQTVYVVEGNISLLQMYQAGIKNCVAMLGSKLSVRQVCLLSRFVKNIVLVPDSDKAGIKFVEKMQDNIPVKLYDADVKFTYVQLPAGNDPDDYFKTHSKEDFLNIEKQELI